MKGTICITKIIEHVVQETKRVFTDMKYDGNCFFYHDTLTQMTNKDMKEWMREKGYLNMWVLPMKGCNAGTPYANSSVGDSPEMMPLDSSLFEDLHAGVHHHITRTMLLDANDPKWFSLATLTKVARAYTHVFDPTLVGPNAGNPVRREFCKIVKKSLAIGRGVQSKRGGGPWSWITKRAPKGKYCRHCKSEARWDMHENK